MIKNTIQNNLEQLCYEYVQEFKDKEIVLGYGRIDSPIVIIGEAPGKDEVKQGKPFVGAAGKNLNEFIEVLKISRDDLYITNAIKYRLRRLNPKTQRVVNRPATMKDIKENQIWLHKEIHLINPQIIVTLGNVPLKAITNDFGISIGDMHGTLQECNLSGKVYKLFPLYHPASIIYNRSLKDVYGQDMLTLKQEVNKLDLNFSK
ncbi:uracil-DNA glycosylase [Ruminiclostridium josui]|uniref:uracil-DNA glycosylase n=1 Tax=Ruminiclostridium josui TaxID=1499 RepID=UPI0004636CBD|nr:uracil-DNA glycosylase [Ruminiclostridium josui]